ncbi:MAG TPA: dynamin family protein [Thermodesulfobacteriota bacterium]|nr:dynamin family protein [Thermodesulfobacteriota bacterium]
MQILDEKYSRLILEEKALLESLLAEIKALSYKDLEEKLNSVRENLENLFSIVFIGEFSTGKSSIINALLGEKVLPEGITPTTDKITILRYGETREERQENGNYYISVPDERLKNILIVDTPGTNVTLEQHEQITQEFIPKADMVFFVIGAERAVTGSEAKLIKFIKEEWLKNIVFLLNKIDIAEDNEELQSLVEHSERELERIFKIKPFIMPISAKLALRAKGSSNTEPYSKSGFEKLEEYIFNTLGEEERVKMKIKSSSELALSLCAETEKTLKSHLDKISTDMKRLGEFEGKLEGMELEVLENSKQFTERIRSRLLEFKTRGIEFIDDLIRFENVFKLIKKEKVAREFESKVSLQTVKELEKDLDTMVAWTERSARTLMDSAIDFYRKSIQPESSSANTGFSFDRTQLIETVRSQLEIKRKQIDPAVLGGNIVDSAREAVASVLGVQVGSLAIGAVVVSAFSSLIIDITGILATLALVATAFAILPKKRRDAMKEFSTKVDTLIEELISSVDFQLERDLDGIRIQILDSLIPLKNFYKTQEKKLLESQKRVEDIKDKIIQIEKSVS